MNETDHYQKKKKKKVIELMKDKLRGKIVRKFALLKAKIHNYLTDNNHKDKKKAMGTKKCAIKQNLNFEVYKHCLEARN